MSLFDRTIQKPSFMFSSDLPEVKKFRRDKRMKEEQKYKSLSFLEEEVPRANYIYDVIKNGEGNLEINIDPQEGSLETYSDFLEFQIIIQNDSENADKNEILPQANQERENLKNHQQSEDFVENELTEHLKNTSAQTKKTESENQTYETKDLGKGLIDYKCTNFHSFGKSLMKSFLENSDFDVIKEIKRLSQKGLLQKKSKRDPTEIETSIQLKSKINPTQASTIKDLNLTNITSPPCPIREINANIRKKISTSLADYYVESAQEGESLHEPVASSTDLLNIETNKCLFMIYKIDKKKLEENKKKQEEKKKKQEERNKKKKTKKNKKAALLNQETPDQKELNTNNEIRKMGRDSINKKIKTNLFNKFLENKFIKKVSFSQELVTDVAIETNKVLIGKTNTKILFEILLKKHHDNREAAQEELLIISRACVDQALLVKTITQLYEEDYLYSEECKMKLKEVVEDGETNEYIWAYEYHLRDFIRYFRDEKPNNGKTVQNETVESHNE